MILNYKWMYSTREILSYKKDGSKTHENENGLTKS